jgi:hypothetical protein
MDPLKVKVAIIQSTLRVRILPVQSKVALSNMACLPKIKVSRAGRESEGRKKDAGGLAALARQPGAGSGNPDARLQRQ